MCLARTRPQLALNTATDSISYCVPCQLDVTLDWPHELYVAARFGA
jgi:hypothetical protein